jgi:predicted anti-sigma-YlaC factor YlaD
MMPCAARRRVASLVILLALPAAGGCGAVKRFAINKLGDTLAEGGSVYESDDDVELVGDALPFGLKLIESLLAQSPRHRGLLLAASQGFTSYAYAYVDVTADEASRTDLDRGKQMRARARRLYLRAHGYGLRGLEITCAGISERLAVDPNGAAAAARLKDVPLLYWSAASLGLAISAARDDAAMLARLPEVAALLDRAMALDEGWQEGSLHEFEITFAGARPGFGLADVPALKRHFDRAKDLSRGGRASLYLSYAEAVSVRTQNAVEFRALLNEALDIDPDARASLRLVNLVSQRRARWLLSRIEELFLDPESAGPQEGGS